MKSSGDTSPAEGYRLEPLWAQIGSRLERRRARIYEEIRAYPSPIPACDAQYNHLLEERSRIAFELREMAEVASACLESDNPMELVEAFLRRSRFIDEASADAILSGVEQESPDRES